MLLCFYSTEGEPVSNKYLTCRMNLSISDHEQGTIDRNIQVLQFLEVLSSSVVGVYDFLLKKKQNVNTLRKQTHAIYSNISRL